jgi:hypothetical protein
MGEYTYTFEVQKRVSQVNVIVEKYFSLKVIILGVNKVNIQCTM